MLCAQSKSVIYSIDRTLASFNMLINLCFYVTTTISMPIIISYELGCLILLGHKEVCNGANIVSVNMKHCIESCTNISTCRCM